LRKRRRKKEENKSPEIPRKEEVLLTSIYFFSEYLSQHIRYIRGGEDDGTVTKRPTSMKELYRQKTAK